MPWTSRLKVNYPTDWHVPILFCTGIGARQTATGAEGLLYYPSDQPRPNCKTRATIALFCHKVKHVSYKIWKGNISLVARSLTPGRVAGVNSVPHACRRAGRWTCPSFRTEWLVWRAGLGVLGCRASIGVLGQVVGWIFRWLCRGGSRVACRVG